MKTLAEQLRGYGLVFEGEDEGAGGKAAEPANGAGADSTPAGAADDKTAGEAEGKKEAAPAGDDKKPDWKDRRLAQLTARLSQANAALAEKTAAPATAPDANETFDALVAEQAAKQARAIAAKASFDEKCNAAAQAGREKFGEKAFNESLDQILSLVDRTNPAEIANYQEFLASAIETGEAPKIIYELGRDPDEVARVLALTPRKMTIELAKMADAGKDPGVSAAPKPITPIDSKGGRHEQIAASDPTKADTLSTSDWMARRNAEIAAQPRRY